MIKDVFIIRSYEKEGEQKSAFHKCGICFGTNRDGSLNFELFHQPGVRFQIRDKTEYPKNEAKPF